MPVMVPLWGRSMEIRRFSGETKGTEFFIGREEMPLSPGKDGPIVYKGSQGTLRKFPADIFLVFGKLDRFFQTVGIKVPVKERFMHADRGENRRGFFQFGGVDGSAIGRETNEKTGSDAFFRNLAGGTCKNLLTTVTD